MPASPYSDSEAFIPPLPTPYGSQRVVPSPVHEEENLPGDMHRQRPYNASHGGGWTPPHPGWTPPAMLRGHHPGGYPPYVTPLHAPRQPGPTPMQPPHPMYGQSPWAGYHAPPGYGHTYHSASYGPGPLPQGPPYHSGAYHPGPLPHDPRGYGPSPFLPQHSVPRGYSNWGPGATPRSGGVPLDHDPMGFPFGPAPRPEEGMIKVDKWEQGNNYGPVLTPFQVAVLDVKLLVNPLLEPPGDTSNQPYLIFNLLFPIGRARRSSDPVSRSWSTGRLSPATWPRVTKLNIVSREFPWVFEIEAARAERGVTCLDVIDGLAEQLQNIVPRSQIEALTGPKGEAHKRKLYDAYYYNRSTAPDAPGGSLGEGVRKVDWLLNRTMYDGILDDQKFIQEKLGIKGRGWNGLKSKSTEGGDPPKEPPKDRMQSWPATFVLRLDVRYSDSEADRVSISDTTEATDETQTQVSEDGS